MALLHDGALPLHCDGIAIAVDVGVGRDEGRGEGRAFISQRSVEQAQGRQIAAERQRRANRLGHHVWVYVALVGEVRNYLLVNNLPCCCGSHFFLLFIDLTSEGQQELGQADTASSVPVPLLGSDPPPSACGHTRKCHSRNASNCFIFLFIFLSVLVALAPGPKRVAFGSWPVPVAFGPWHSALPATQAQGARRGLHTQEIKGPD